MTIEILCTDHAIVENQFYEDAQFLVGYSNFDRHFVESLFFFSLLVCLDDNNWHNTASRCCPPSNDHCSRPIKPTTVFILTLFVVQRCCDHCLPQLQRSSQAHTSSEERYHFHPSSPIPVASILAKERS